MFLSQIRCIVPVLAVLALAACSGPEPDEQEREVTQAQQAAESAAQLELADTAAPAAYATSCDASQAEGLVGKAADPDAAEQARIDTGAKEVRILKPDQAVTLEFNGDRLNIEVDEYNIVTSVRCG
ncbi:MAG: Elastase inhibitor AFLEI Flags: Precursor [Xanthomonadaceae bacterium]|jgi:uncharacterized lipoprotein|nr:Elastase inhibitor AFLEI Flags: Precursor [Xanthomonadaceae bacterium]